MTDNTHDPESRPDTFARTLAEMREAEVERDRLAELTRPDPIIERAVELLAPRHDFDRVILRAAVVAAADVTHETGDPDTFAALLAEVVLEATAPAAAELLRRETARANAAEAERDRLHEREVALAHGLLAILRTHEEGGEPETWTLKPHEWGDGRRTWEVHERHVNESGGRVSGLVCQFRPDDIDGTEQDANACVSAALAGVRLAREVLARGTR